MPLGGWIGIPGRGVLRSNYTPITLTVMAGAGENDGACKSVRLDRSALQVLESSRPTEPWVPSSFVVFPVGRSKTTKRRNGSSAACWDVRGRADGWDFLKRFTAPKGTAEQAKSWARRLGDDYTKGWPFDLGSKCFVDPSARRADTAPSPTVFSCSLDYLDRKWEADWEPKSRQSAVRAIHRACLRLLRLGAPEPGPEVEACLNTLLTGPGKRPVELDPRAEAGRQFLKRWSMPIAEVDRDDLERFLALYRTNQRDPSKAISPTTERRFVADLKQLWSDAAVRHGFSNPWPTIRVRTRSKHGRGGSGQIEALDLDAVLSPAQVVEIADVCSRKGTWGEVVRCFVLVMGFCGLRPGEATGLTIGDLELSSSGTSWITVRRSRRRIPDRWLEPDEDPEWGPLKDRGVGDGRRIPVPTSLAEELTDHIERFCDRATPSALLFQRKGKPFVSSSFVTEVWHPAREEMFPPRCDIPVNDPRQPRRSRIRCHDLRHAACSMWLNARVDPKICQRWSGHRTLSVFLDIYQGVMPGREDEGVKLVGEFLGALSVNLA